MAAQSLEHVGRLADEALGLLKHIKQVAELAQQTGLADAGSCSVLQSNIPYQRHEMKQL